MITIILTTIGVLTGIAAGAMFAVAIVVSAVLEFVKTVFGIPSCCA